MSSAEDPEAPAWLDGRLVAQRELPPPASEADLCCYTTCRFEAGRVYFARRVAARLVHDAGVLGLGRLDAAGCERALRALGEAAFGSGAGIVRLEARPGVRGTARCIGTARPLGTDSPPWRAVVSPVVHPGPDVAAGVKRVRTELAEARRRLADRADPAEEALLFDRQGRLVEGTRSSLVVVDARGRLLTPAAALGGVASVTLAALRDAGVALEEASLSRTELDGAREIVALNAVRGARPIVHLEGVPVADGRPGATGARLAERLAGLR